MTEASYYPQNIQGRVFNILDLENTNVDTTIAVAGQVTVNSASFVLLKDHTYSWQVQFESSGVINIKVELEQQFAKVLKTDSDQPWAVPDNKTDEEMFPAIEDADVHQTAYSPNATLKGRLKLTGLTGNDASTELTNAMMSIAKNYG